MTWRPGQSGNPGGRPKGTQALSRAYREVLDEPCTLRSPMFRGMTWAKAIATMLVHKAVRGNIHAAAELGNRTEGTPRPIITIEGSEVQLNVMQLVERLAGSTADRPASQIIASRIERGSSAPDAGGAGGNGSAANSGVAGNEP